MFGRSKELDLERRCLDLVVTSDRQRRELGDSVREVKDQFRWIESIATAAKSSGPLLMAAAGVSGLWLGRGGKGGLLSWIPRLQVGLKVFRTVRQLFRTPK